MVKIDFNKKWISQYVYSVGTSTHSIQFQQVNNLIVGKSLPNSEGSEINMELKLDKNVLTGTWRERTSHKGPYKGEEFYGAVQFILNDHATEAEGKWLGFNKDKTKVNTGEWILKQS